MNNSAFWSGTSLSSDPNGRSSIYFHPLAIRYVSDPSMERDIKPPYYDTKGLLTDLRMIIARRPSWRWRGFSCSGNVRILRFHSPWSWWVIAKSDWASFVRTYECGCSMSFLLLHFGIDLDDQKSGSEGCTTFDRIFGVNTSSFIQSEEYLYGLLI